MEKKYTRLFKILYEGYIYICKEKGEKRRGAPLKNTLRAKIVRHKFKHQNDYPNSQKTVLAQHIEF